MVYYSECRKRKIQKTEVLKMTGDSISTSVMKTLLNRYPALTACAGTIVDAYCILRDSIREGGTVFVCGNGGSHADADHIIGELSKGFLSKRKVPKEIVRQFSENLGEDASGLCARLQMGIRAMLLSAHPALSSAYANDVDPQMCYAQQLFVAGRKGDVVIGLSTSGNAENIRNVFQVAGGLGIRRILFTGNRHGACERYADCVIDVPEAETYKIQELHLPVYHAVCIMLEEYFYGGK